MRCLFHCHPSPNNNASSPKSMNSWSCATSSKPSSPPPKPTAAVCLRRFWKRRWLRPEGIQWSYCHDSANSTNLPAAPAAPESAFEKARSFDRIVVAGQPTLDDLKSLKERGIVQVAIFSPSSSVMAASNARVSRSFTSSKASSKPKSNP